MPVETDRGPVIVYPSSTAVPRQAVDWAYDYDSQWNVSTNPCNVRATDVMTAVYGFSSVMSKVLGRLNKDDVVFSGKTLHLQGNKADDKTFASGSKTWDYCGTASRERVKRQETTSNEGNEQGRCAGQEAVAGSRHLHWTRQHG
ncbi:hypothetical protein COCC4DRAFT_20677 [Bipolaris maydis ATCC 48331]|uniref:Uncharacterized protein n=2 Tax=Cochliobolus heterostrophus TaxID=5016 RepID=M2T1C1_COCH5|nr:uncharacterized protein COCC4DRAFT_20677 [Bipolaris maydis ATCC 48331]EMD91370.1 hypothetical protein COCHEDRAFT_1030207 [Bipolaris maydis C5]ENI08870.1 hypothetical protein COCC4DRAFT_20677 [Bipolaris maydis ATCC 48331]